MSKRRDNIDRLKAVKWEKKTPAKKASKKKKEEPKAEEPKTEKKIVKNDEE